MIINFRQGIIAAQVNNNYLQLVGGKVNINVDIQRLDIAFAYGTHDYLFTEAEAVVGAWGPFPTGVDTYLYWDIDLATGLRTFGTTLFAPSYGNSLPANPSVGQNFFDYTDKKMKVWGGAAWNEKLRVFAGKIGSGGVFTPQALGSQVALNGQISLGYILFDSNNVALRVVDRSGRYYFLTTEDPIHTQQDIHNAYKIDSILMDGRAIEPIPAYHCLTWKGPKQLGVASYIDYTRPCIGISVEPAGINEVKQFITKGFLTNYNNWNWTQAPNTPLFVGSTGQITVDVPQQYSLQKVGHIVSSDTVFIDLQEIVWIENKIPGPTPSPTPTVTPSRSLSLTPSPTPTTSLSPSVTMTSTVTPTPTSSLGISPTPTPTHTQSATTTVTPSVTVSPSPTLTSTPTLTPTLTVTPSVTTSPVVISGSPDMISLFYKAKSPLTNDNDGTSQVSLSSFDGTTRTDVSQFGVSWRTASAGEDVGDKFTRKLRGFNSGGFITINPPNFVSSNDSNGNLYTSGIYSGNDFENDSSGVASITYPIFTIPNNGEGSLPISAYAVDTTTGLQYGSYRESFGDQIDSVVVFSNGVQLVVNELNSFTNSNSLMNVGLHGMDVLGDGTAFMFAVEDETSRLTMVKFNVSDVDVNNGSVNVTYTFSTLESGDTVPAYHLDNVEDVNGEIYESKSFGDKDFISVANNTNSKRQDLFLTSQSQLNSNESYVAVYNRTTQQLENVIYNVNDYGYISITDNYLFVINPSIPPSSLVFGANSTNIPQFCELDIRSVDSNNAVTDVTTFTLTNHIMQNQFQGMSATDARLRTVKSNENTITVYTFGFGIYVFDIPSHTVTYSGVSDIYNDGNAFGLAPSASAYTDIVIDTWAGKLPFVPPSPTPTPTVTPTISVTPTGTPGPLVANNYDPLVLTANPTHYWSLKNNLTDDVGTVSLSPLGAATTQRDSYGSLMSFPDAANRNAFVLSDLVSLVNNYSLEVWVHLPTIPSPSYRTIFGVQDGDINGSTYGLQFDSGNNLYLYGSTADIIAPTLAFDVDHHIVVNVDGSGVVTCYVNGVVTGTSTTPDTFNIKYLGTDHSDENFVGTIGNPAIYLNANLTESQIQAHYTAGLTTANYRYTP